MALEDIERLREKLEKDPGSKLFVPLAEEYKKAGMIDEAIDVLTRGLEMQPHYLSARVSLGKIFIEKGMPVDAKSEFEKVIASIPDNLYAHKKLAEIYRDLGEKESAIKEFRTVLKLNPMDEWAVSALSALEEEQNIPGQESSFKEAQDISHPEEKPEEELPFKINLEEREEPPSYVSPETEEEAGQEEPSPEIFASEETPASRGLPSEEVEESVIEEIREEQNIQSGDSEISEEDMELWKTHLEAIDEMEEAEGIGTAKEETSEETWELPSEVIAEAEQTGEPVTDEAELQEEPTLSFEDILKEADVAEGEEKIFAEAEAVSEKPETGQTLADADRYIQQGRYREVMNIYKTILADDPGNSNILQRIEELKMLLKIFGKDKDKEDLIMKLEEFMEGIKKRRDEFLGNS
jgi:tetratricopeptide (TPR) repeat protein